MTISRFTLWEFAIGGASAVGFLILTGLSLRGTLLGLLLVAMVAAVLAKHLLAMLGTFVAVWVALPLWAPVVPGAGGLPTVGAVIDPTATTTDLGVTDLPGDPSDTGAAQGLDEEELSGVQAGTGQADRPDAAGGEGEAAG